MISFRRIITIILYALFIAFVASATNATRVNIGDLSFVLPDTAMQKPSIPNEKYIYEVFNKNIKVAIVRMGIHEHYEIKDYIKEDYEIAFYFPEVDGKCSYEEDHPLKDWTTDFIRQTYTKDDGRQYSLTRLKANKAHYLIYVYNDGSPQGRAQAARVNASITNNSWFTNAKYYWLCLFAVVFITLLYISKDEKMDKAVTDGLIVIALVTALIYYVTRSSPHLFWRIELTYVGFIIAFAIFKSNEFLYGIGYYIVISWLLIQGYNILQFLESATIKGIFINVIFGSGAPNVWNIIIFIISGGWILFFIFYYSVKESISKAEVRSEPLTFWLICLVITFLLFDPRIISFLPEFMSSPLSILQSHFYFHINDGFAISHNLDISTVAMSNQYLIWTFDIIVVLAFSAAINYKYHMFDWLLDIIAEIIS